MMGKLMVLRIQFTNPGGGIGSCNICGKPFEVAAGEPVIYLGRWVDGYFSEAGGGQICPACFRIGPQAASAKADRLAADIRAQATRVETLAEDLAALENAWAVSSEIADGED